MRIFANCNTFFLFVGLQSMHYLKGNIRMEKKYEIPPEECEDEVKTTDRKKIKEMFLQKLTAAGKEAKQIAAGKKKGKTLDELLK